jgi:hypothetical protein
MDRVFDTAAERARTRLDVPALRTLFGARKRPHTKGRAGKPGHGRRYHVHPSAARTIAALLALRDHVIAPILAGVRRPQHGHKPTHPTAVDLDYENLRLGMQALFHNLGITTTAAAA